MKIKNGMKILGAISVLLVIFSVIIGRITEKSYIDNVELDQYLANPSVTVAYYGMGYDPVTNRGYVDNDQVQCIADLMRNDVVVVKAKLNGKFQRKLYYECILSQIDIVKCYSGDLEEGDRVNVFEPVDCGFTDQMLCVDGYSLLQPDKEYILFLKTLKNTYFGKGKYVYAPISTRYGKYQVGDHNPKLFSYEELEEPESLRLYSEVKDQEVYLYEKDEYDKFLELKSEVMEKYE